MLLPMYQTVEDKLAESAATIALHNFIWHYPTLVLFNSAFICSVNIFLRTYQKNVYVARGRFYPGYVKRVQQYVIFGIDLPDIVDMLNWMQKHELDNTAQYIVICQSLQCDKCNEDDLVNMLWNYKIVDVVLINNRKEKPVNGFIYDYPEDCKTPRPINLENLDSCLLNGPEHCLNLFPLKLKNLHHCPIIVSTFQQVPYMNLSSGTPTGADGDLLCVIADAMNFSLVMMTPRIGYGWGKVEDNGTWTGSLADLYNDWANFSMTSASITLSRFSTFQMSIDYSVVTIAWITHPSNAQPSSLKLLRPFQMNVHIALGVSFIMVVLFIIFLRSNFLQLLRQKLNVAIPNDMLFDTWALCMGVPITYLPTNKALLSLAVIWMWYCLLIRTLYQVYLMNSLKTDVYYPEFNTIEEAIECSHPFGGGLALRDYFIENPLVYNEWQDVESVDIYPFLVKLSQGWEFVLAMNLEIAKFFLAKNPDKNLHVLSQVILLSPIPIFFKKYSPLVKPLNVVLSRLTESGIIQKIYMDHTGTKGSNRVQDDNIPISMVHYTGCYAILLIGWLLSALCLVVEKLVHHKKKRKNVLIN